MTDQADLLARLRAFNGLLGTTFSGNRDVYAAFGYEFRVTYKMALNRWKRQDIASRVVDSEPRAIWSLPPVPEGDEVFAEKWSDLIARHSLHLRMEQLDRMIGLGEFGVLVIGLSDGLNLKEPAQFENGLSVTFLRAHGAGNVTITKYEENVLSERFGMPTMYEINVGGEDLGNVTRAQGISKTYEVHHSRILHVAENTLDNDLFGSPRIARVYNLLQDIEKIAGGSAETFWMTANRGMQLDVDKDMTLTEEDAEALSDEVDEYIHGMRRFMRTKGVEINTLGSDMADPRGVFGVLTALLAGATGIPQRILLGSEAGQLASAQDRANWASRVESRRSTFVEPIMLNPLVKKLVGLGVLPAPTALSWVWPEAFRQSPLERSMTSAQQARSLANVSKALSSEVPVVSLEEGRQIIESAGSIPMFNEVADTMPTDTPATVTDETIIEEEIV